MRGSFLGVMVSSIPIQKLKCIWSKNNLANAISKLKCGGVFAIACIDSKFF